MSEPIEITVKGSAEIAKMQPGDVLLVKVDAILSDEMVRRIEDQISRRLPEGVKLLIAGRGIDFSIVRPPSEGVVA